MVIIRPDPLRFALTYLAQRCFMLPLVWFLFQVLNRVRFEGLENLQGLEGRPIILAPNHTSAWDVWIGTLWPLSSLRRLLSGRTYTCVWAAPENIPTIPLRILTSLLGAIPVDRERGIEQHSIKDTVRLMREGKRDVVITIYPEGTRSRTGRLKRRGKAGLGWLQHQTGAVVVPIYHVGAKTLPGMHRQLRCRIGRPLVFDHYADEPAEPATWRKITAEVMESLHALETEELGPDGTQIPPAPAERRAA